MTDSHTLVMTHMVPAPADAEAEQGWIDDAAVAFSGKIVVGNDLQSFCPTTSGDDQP